MKVRACILLLIFLRSVWSVALCCDTNVATVSSVDSLEEAYQCVTSCCSSHTQNSNNDSDQPTENNDNHDTSHCSCTHLGSMHEIESPYVSIEMNISNHRSKPSYYSNSYFHLHNINVFQPPKV